MSSTPREIGTLIVVILKAKNLPNKRHIGKQDPYCVVSLDRGSDKRRTKAIKRGGQHPEWDEEIRFTIFESVEEELARIADGSNTPPPPPPKGNRGYDVKGRTMRLLCYADDPREPDLIGESIVDLTEALTKGETDEWFTLMNKDKYCGEVYLELTFWSNEKPPARKPAPKAQTAGGQYGGPGSFTPLASRDGINASPSNANSSSPLRDPGYVNTASTLTSSVSLYSSPGRAANTDQIAGEFGDLHVSDVHRRGTYPPVQGGYPSRVVSTSSISTLPVHHEHYSEPGTFDAPTYHNSTLTGPPQSYVGQEPYHQFEVTPSSSFVTRLPSSRGPRYSLPTSSSGFIPLSDSSNFHPPPEQSGFMPQMSRTPAPSGYEPSLYSQSGFVPAPVQTPTPTGYQPLLGHDQYSHSQQYLYDTYPSQPTSSASLQYIQPQHTNTPSSFQGYPPNASPSPHEQLASPRPPPPPPPLPNSVGGSSRPLPPQPLQQPQGFAPLQSQFNIPSSASQSIGHYSPPQNGLILFPPPAPPPLPNSPVLPPIQSQYGLPLPPPPPPPSQFLSSSPSGRPSLPQPPTHSRVVQQENYSNLIQESYPVETSYQNPVYTGVPPPPPPPPPANYGTSQSQLQQYGYPYEASWLPPNGALQPSG